MIDEAIKHCEEKAKELNIQSYTTDDMTDKERFDCLECAREHEQLAEWLTQLKQVQNIVEHWNDESSSFVSACNAFEDILHVFGKGVGDGNESSN